MPVNISESNFETSIAQLEEYRTALISAAVTGKIDVHQAALHSDVCLYDGGD